MTLVKEYREIFGEDYYIELQSHGISEQERILPYLLRVAKDTGTQLSQQMTLIMLKKRTAMYSVC